MSKASQRKISAYSQGRDDFRRGHLFRLRKVHPLYREYRYGYKGFSIDGELLSKKMGNLL